MRLTFKSALLCAAMALGLAAGATVAQDLTPPPDPGSVTSVVQSVTGVIITTLLPVLFTAIAGYAVVAGHRLQQLIGSKNAALLMDKIKEAIDNSILNNETDNAMKTPNEIGQEAVDHLREALPDALKAVSAKDGPLMVLAGSRLTQLVNAGLTTFLGAPAPKPAPL